MAGRFPAFEAIRLLHQGIGAALVWALCFPFIVSFAMMVQQDRVFIIGIQVFKISGGCRWEPMQLISVFDLKAA